MINSITAVRGMNDILANDIIYWQFIEQKLKLLADSYGYSEIRLPIVEHTELFKRSVGDGTDIIEKEMYCFNDRNGDGLTLRPEGTAGVVRAGIEHSLFYGDNPKVWYLGPMFRHERPQKGRYRQFYQFGLEAFGYSSAYIDAEILAFCARLWQLLGIADQVKLQINCLGTPEVRAKYKQALVAYFTKFIDQLDEDSKRRLDKNPLRILDSKNPDLKTLINAAPKLTDYLDDCSSKHMQILCANLSNLNIKYEVNPFLVRGLDYYCFTVFEWVTDDLGAQGTVCAGGRYDGLVAQMGGDHTPAIGMSIGLERLVLMLQEQKKLSHVDLDKYSPDCYIMLLGDLALSHGLVLAEKIRNFLPGLKIITNTTGQAFKNQFKKADKSKAKLAIIIGEDEVAKCIYTIKWLRENKAQVQVNFEELIDLLKEQ
jgi:histidyl-tRNA synthetase